MSKALRRLSYIDVAQAQQRKQKSSTSETVPTPVSNASNPGALNLGASESGSTIETHVVNQGKEDFCVEQAIAVSDSSFIDDAPNPGAPNLQEQESHVYRAPLPPPRLAISAQDGHTHGEQNLLATLWRLAKPTRSGTARLITIGERTLAKQVPMSYSTVQKNIRSLMNKMAIEVRNEGLNKPKTYLIFDDEEILSRRQAVGLTHVLRRTNGVWLVNCE